jgi:hypothetical protein
VENPELRKTKEHDPMKHILFSVLGLLLISAAAVGQSDGGGRLAGTWDMVVTGRNCDTGAPLISFQTVVSFNQGGTYSGLSAGRPPTLRTPELGVWKHVRENLYSYRWKAYLFNAAGVATGYQIVTQDLELDQDGINSSSSGISQAFTLEGVLTGTACSTIVGTRVVLE